MPDDIEIRPTQQGQAPGLACALLLLGALGALVGFVFWPAWLLTGLVLVWVVIER